MSRPRGFEHVSRNRLVGPAVKGESVSDDFRSPLRPLAFTPPYLSSLDSRLTFLSLPLALIPESLEHSHDLLHQVQGSSSLLPRELLQEPRPRAAVPVDQDLAILLEERNPLVEERTLLGRGCGGCEERADEGGVGRVGEEGGGGERVTGFEG